MIINWIDVLGPERTEEDCITYIVGAAVEDRPERAVGQLQGPIADRDEHRVAGHGIDQVRPQVLCL